MNIYPQLLKLTLAIIILITEIIGSPLKFPESSGDIRSVEIQPTEDSEPRFHHHHKKKKFHKLGCGQGHFHKRFKRQSHSEGRFFFPILNYYDTDIIVSNGQYGSNCGSIGENEKPVVEISGKPPLGGLVGLGNLGSGLGSGLGSLGSGLGNFGSDLSSGLGSLLPSIGNGIPSLGSGLSQPGRPPAPVATRPPAPVFTRPPATRPPIISPPQTTTDSGDDGDSEDYDYTDFSTTVRSRPIPGTVFTGHRPMPITNPLVNSIKPVFERPESYFNRYIVRPINRTLREFYSLF